VTQMNTHEMKWRHWYLCTHVYGYQHVLLLDIQTSISVHKYMFFAWILVLCVHSYHVLIAVL
jgi:hypothetical protein